MHNVPKFWKQGIAKRILTTSLVHTELMPFEHPMLELSYTNVPVVKDDAYVTIPPADLVRVFNNGLDIKLATTEKELQAVKYYSELGLIDYMKFLRIHHHPADMLSIDKAVTELDGKHCRTDVLNWIKENMMKVFMVDKNALKDGTPWQKTETSKPQTIRRTRTYVELNWYDVIRTYANQAHFDIKPTWLDERGRVKRKKHKDDPDALLGRRFCGTIGTTVEHGSFRGGDITAIVIGREPDEDYNPSAKHWGRGLKQLGDDGCGYLFILQLAVFDAIRASDYELLMGPHKEALKLHRTPLHMEPKTKSDATAAA